MAEEARYQYACYLYEMKKYDEAIEVLYHISSRPGAFALRKEIEHVRYEANQN